jgi:hypothetical protein
MIFGNRVAKMKLVEQLTLVTLLTAHHGSTSSRITLPGLSQPTFATKSANNGSRALTSCKKKKPPEGGS